MHKAKSNCKKFRNSIFFSIKQFSFQKTTGNCGHCDLYSIKVHTAWIPGKKEELCGSCIFHNPPIPPTVTLFPSLYYSKFKYTIIYIQNRDDYVYYINNYAVFYLPLYHSKENWYWRENQAKMHGNLVGHLYHSSEVPYEQFHYFLYYTSHKNNNHLIDRSWGQAWATHKQATLVARVSFMVGFWGRCRILERRGHRSHSQAEWSC